MTDLVIPKNIKSGNYYWLGCIVDADNKAQESIESNNASYLGIIIEQ